MYIACSVLSLGYTRIAGVQAYNTDTRAFDELTPAVARKLIKSGELLGVLWEEPEMKYEEGRFVPDKEGFNKQNIIIKTAVGKFRPMYDDLPDQPLNSMYNIVKVIHTDYRGTLYEIVSNRCDRIKVTEKQLRGLNEISPVAGIWITDSDIRVHEKIKIEDRRAVVESITTEKEPTTMEEVFADEVVDTKPKKAKPQTKKKR